MEDTELFQARDPRGEMFALKVVRRKKKVTAALMIEHEARIIRHLCSQNESPPKIIRGELEGRVYIALPWFCGVSVDVVAEEYRKQGGKEGGENLIALCLSVLNAYSQLHEQGVIHGDVHPRNILVDAEGQIQIIDFGLARFTSAENRSPSPPRGGVAFFFEPEYARARLEHRPLPPTSRKSEQYALAALAYYLLTGDHYPTGGFHHGLTSR